LRDARHRAKHFLGVLSLQPRLWRDREPDAHAPHVPLAESTVAYDAIVAMRTDQSRYDQLASEASDLEREAIAAKGRGAHWEAFELSAKAVEIHEAQLKALPSSLRASRQLCWLLRFRCELSFDLMRPAEALALSRRHHAVTAEQLARRPTLPCALADALRADRASLIKFKYPIGPDDYAAIVEHTTLLHQVAPGRQPLLFFSVSTCLGAAFNEPDRFGELVALARELIDAQRQHAPRDAAIAQSERLFRVMTTLERRLGAQGPVPGEGATAPS
jgi:hypothetical protein